MKTSPRRNVVNPSSTRSTLNSARRTMPCASQRSTTPSQANACEPFGRSLRTWMGLPGGRIFASSRRAAVSDVRLLRDQRLETRLVDDRRTELLGFGQLRARVLAGDQVAGLPGHRVAECPAELFDALLDLRAAVVLETPGHHQRQP